MAALRGTDVLLGADDDGVKEALEFACGEKEETYGTSSPSSTMPRRTRCWSNSVSSRQKKAPIDKCCTRTSPSWPYETLYSVFIALQDVTQDMGPTLFVLNSHDKRTHDQLRKRNMDGERVRRLENQSVRGKLKKAFEKKLTRFIQPFEHSAKVARTPHGRRALLTLTFLKLIQYQTNQPEETKSVYGASRGRVPQAVQ